MSDVTPSRYLVKRLLVETVKLFGELSECKTRYTFRKELTTELLFSTFFVFRLLLCKEKTLVSY